VLGNTSRNGNAGQRNRAGQSFQRSAPLLITIRQETRLAWTIESWLEHLLENIAGAGLRATSYDAYRTAVRKHLIPKCLEASTRTAWIFAGARPATAHQVHRTIRTALGEALSRGYVSRNVATIAKPPRVEVEPAEPYTLEEIGATMTAAQQGPSPDRCLRLRS
jgi:integrase